MTSLMNDLSCPFQSSVDITDLIYEAYTKFGDISSQHIDKLRLKYRLRVVQVSK